jgi:hypothetical protein
MNFVQSKGFLITALVYFRYLPLKEMGLSQKSATMNKNRVGRTLWVEGSPKK